MLIISIIPYELEMTQCHHEIVIEAMASPLLVKTALWTKYLYFFVVCTFSVYFQAAHYLVLILMHTQEKIFLQTYEFLLESRCVITIVSKEIG